MKQVRSQADIELANELAKLVESRRELEKREKELKEYFKAKADGAGEMKVGNVLFLFTEKCRENIDKSKVMSLLGSKFKEVVSTVTYIQTDVRKAE